MINSACLLINTEVLCMPAILTMQCLCTSIFVVFSGSSVEMSSADNQSTKQHNKSSAAVSHSSLLSVKAIQTNFHQQVVERQARELARLTSLPRGFKGHLRERRHQRGFQFEGPHPGSQTSSVPRFLWAHPLPFCPSPDGCHTDLLP